MPSVQQILDWVDRKYPNTETDANKVIDLNEIHKKVVLKLSRIKNDFSMTSDTTIADQATYTLPSDCSLDNIIAIRVSQSIAITSTTEWEEYKYAGVNDDVTYGHRYGSGGAGVYALLDEGAPISTAGFSIRIFYYKNPVELLSTNLTAIPELDANYHDLLKFGLTSDLASQGHNPDTEIADFWQAKYDEFMRDVEANLNEKYSSRPTQSTQCREVW
jgi:hypothetical protein